MTPAKILLAALPALALSFTTGMLGTAHASTKKKTESHMSAKLPGYKTEAEAKSACGASAVVWHATGSKAYHTAKSKYFGKTKHGAYVCEKAAMDDHLHAAKN